MKQPYPQGGGELREALHYEGYKNHVTAAVEQQAAAKRQTHPWGRLVLSAPPNIRAKITPSEITYPGFNI